MFVAEGSPDHPQGDVLHRGSHLLQHALDAGDHGVDVGGAHAAGPVGHHGHVQGLGVDRAAGALAGHGHQVAGVALHDPAGRSEGERHGPALVDADRVARDRRGAGVGDRLDARDRAQLRAAGDSAPGRAVVRADRVRPGARVAGGRDLGEVDHEGSTAGRGGHDAPEVHRGGVGARLGGVVGHGEGESVGLRGHGASRELERSGLGRGVEGVVEVLLAVDLQADVDGVRREHQDDQRQHRHQDRDDPALVAFAG